MNKEPITITGLEKLKEELVFLKEKKRPEIVAAIAEARSHGDLKENAEYHAAKEQQSHNEGRIQEIEDIIARANVIDVTKINNEGKVIFGSTVFLQNLDNNEKIDYKIVGKDEANLKQKLPTAIVLERNPGPGDLPEHEAPNVIPDCTQLIITASTWVNGSLPSLLKLVKTAHVSLIGPGTPFSPLLKEYGIDKLGGFLVQKPDELSQLIQNGAGVRQFKHLGVFGTIDL